MLRRCTVRLEAWKVVASMLITLRLQRQEKSVIRGFCLPTLTPPPGRQIEHRPGGARASTPPFLLLALQKSFVPPRRPEPRISRHPQFSRALHWGTPADNRLERYSGISPARPAACFFTLIFVCGQQASRVQSSRSKLPRNKNAAEKKNKDGDVMEKNGASKKLTDSCCCCRQAE